MKRLSVPNASNIFHINLLLHSAVHHFALVPPCILLLSNIPFLLPTRSLKRPSSSPLSSFITKPSHLPPTHPLSSFLPAASPLPSLLHPFTSTAPSHYRLITLFYIKFACRLSFLLQRYKNFP